MLVGGMRVSVGMLGEVGCGCVGWGVMRVDVICYDGYD